MDGRISMISQLKLQLKNAIQNLKELENIEHNNGQPSSQVEYEGVMRQTDVLLKQLEAAPLEKLCNIITKRRKKRNASKRSKRVRKLADKALSNKNTVMGESSNCDSTATTAMDNKLKHASTSVTSTVEKPHQQLRNCYDAQKYLRTFELLKMLHLARTADATATRQFAVQFQNLRAVWNSVLQENKPQRTQKRQIEDQWDEVLFGPNEQTYYGQKQRLADFLRVRQTWDSYLVRSKKDGSSIPHFWVLPPEKTNAAWAAYKADSK